MRSLFAGLAAIWFAWNAFTFLPAMAVYLNDGAPGGIDGDPGGLAITYAARALFSGMTLVSLALIDWAWLVRRIRRWSSRA
jgi:hypothetical protein